MAKIDRSNRPLMRYIIVGVFTILLIAGIDQMSICSIFPRVRNENVATQIAYESIRQNYARSIEKLGVALPTSFPQFLSAHAGCCAASFNNTDGWWEVKIHLGSAIKPDANVIVFVNKCGGASESFANFQVSN